MDEHAKTASPLLKNFFENFLSKELEKEDISNEYSILLKILWLSFDEIITKSKIARRIHILQLIEKYLIDVEYQKIVDTTELPKTDAFLESQGSETPKIKLEKIDIVNFRGFRANSDGTGRKIIFNGKTNLFFAPNGGGKSSLCEALEWLLTGDTSEHAQRNTESTDTYFQNRDVTEPSYKMTKLHLLEEFSPDIPNMAFDRCFLEKNRIEKFAKIATQKGVEVQNILGELFGLTEIVDFFKEFGQDLSPTPNEKDEIENWQIWIDWEVKKRDLEKSLEESKGEEVAASEEFNKLLDNKKYDDKKKEIEEKIQKLKKELESLSVDNSIQFSSEDFLGFVEGILERLKQWKECKNEIEKNAANLNFESLYQTASKIFQNNQNISECPLCDTPITQNGGLLSKHKCVVTDPREKTKSELKKLEALTTLKNKKSDTESDIRNDFAKIKVEWAKIHSNLKGENWSVISNNVSKPEIPNIDTQSMDSLIYDDFEAFVESCEKAFNQNFSLIREVEKVISLYMQKRQELKSKKQEQNDKIDELSETLDKLEATYETFSNKKAIWEKSNIRLEKLKKQSGNSSVFKKLLDEYIKLHGSLHDFLSSAILTEAKDIDSMVTGFYRALNLHDHDGEIVKDIKFPKKIQEDFCLIYQKDEESICNALQVLSEGHLKTLGLAALLARAAKLNTSLLVFDDAINAIDSDHRDNIAHLLAGKFGDEQGESAFGNKWGQIKDYLGNCQFIITSHDRFFDEKLANLFEKDNQIRYVLYCSQNGIDFCEMGTPANFEKKIEDYLNPSTQDIRSAIFYCRIWLEDVLFNIAIHFRKPSNNRQIEFSNFVDRKTKSLKNPELTTLLDKLVSNLNNDDTSDEYKQIASILEQIRQEKDGKYIWFFEILNQESHYRRNDHIDISNAPTSQEVETIFNNIQKIHELNSRS